MKKKNTGKFNYSSSANQGCNQHVNMFKRIDFAELQRSVNMIKWHFMVILVNLSSKFPFDISRLWVDQSWKKWCQLSLRSSVRPCILNQFSNRKWLIYLNLKLKKQGRIHGQYQSRTGGQGRKCVFSHFSTRSPWTDRPTDGRTDGRTDGQSLL